MRNLTGRRARAVFAILAALAAIFWMDRISGAAPVQHLYYVPIIVASVWLPGQAGLYTALTAVVLYHVANAPLWRVHYSELDIVQVALFVGVALVTSRIVRDAREMRRLAATDDLTGLHNLRSFEARLAALVAASRTRAVPLAMLVLDVDRLKQINDTYGHAAGADAVRTIGQVLATKVPAAGVACRFGGDEFAVALPERTVCQARRLAEHLCADVAAIAPMLEGVAFPAGTLTISVGVAMFGGDPANGSEPPRADAAAAMALFKSADRALYRAKAEGRNRVSVG